LCVGSAWSVSHLMDSDANCPDGVGSSVGIVLGLGWTFLFLGPTVLTCVICCACFSNKDYVATDEEFEAKETKKQQRQQQQQQQAITNTDNNNISNNNSTGSSSNDNNSNNADVRNPPSGDLESPAALKAKASGEEVPPATYSVDGVPIEEVNSKNANHGRRGSGVSSISGHTFASAPPEADVFMEQKQQRIPEVVAEEILPPAMPPPPQATKADTTASVSQRFGGWFGGGGGGGGGGGVNTDNQNAKPDVTATVY